MTPIALTRPLVNLTDAAAGRRSCHRTRKKNGVEVACTIKATWKVGLSLRSHRDDIERHYMIEAAVVCNHCRTTVTLDNFVDGRIFAYVSQQAISVGWPPPRRNLTKLVFESLVTGKVG